MKRSILPLSVASAIALASCTGGQTTVPQQTAVNPVAITKLQLAVGTANVNGSVGLNVVATLRQNNGDSILFDTPTLTGPFTFAIPAAAASSATIGSTWAKNGPSAAEIAGTFIGSTNPANTVPPNQTGATVPASAQTTFGLYGGLSATGFHNSNSSTASTIATTLSGTTSGPSVVPYFLPIYGGTAATRAVRAVPWVGPPAYAGPTGIGTRDGTFVNGLTGVDPGISVFDGVTPGAGTYTMNVIVPTGFTSAGVPTSSTLTPVSATLANPATTIGAGAPIPAPTIVLPGDGTASVTVALPAGATGALVFIRDAGPASGTSCWVPGPNSQQNSATFNPPAVYTLNVTASGTYTLAGNLGPRAANLSAVHSICNSSDNTASSTAQAGSATPAPGDTVTVQMVAYNYNLPSLIPALSQGVQAPAMPTGDADIGISAISAGVTSP